MPELLVEMQMRQQQKGKGTFANAKSENGKFSGGSYENNKKFSGGKQYGGNGNRYMANQAMATSDDNEVTPLDISQDDQFAIDLVVATAFYKQMLKMMHSGQGTSSGRANSVINLSRLSSSSSNFAGLCE